MSQCNDATSKCVKCDVKNCKYHNTEGTCSAGSIEVGPSHAATTSDTVCRTFIAK